MKMLIRTIVILFALASSGSVAPAQTAATSRVMREKLVHSQKILEAIVTSNFALLDRESESLVNLTKVPAWTILQGPEYLRQSGVFLEALAKLREAATQRDLDAAATAYNGLTTSCFACHRYMKDRRLAE